MGSVRALDTAVELVPGDHAAWAYDGPVGLRAVWGAYLAEGIRLGERLLYVGSRVEADLVDDLAEVPGRDELIDGGRLLVRRLADLYVPGQPDHLQVEVLRRQAEEAVAAGFAGLRLASEVTSLISQPGQPLCRIEYELAVDTMYATRHATALCAFDRQQAGRRAGDAAALHRIRHLGADQLAFALVLSPGVVHLVGEVDTTTADDLDRLLVEYHDATDGPLVVDLLDLEFIDVAATRVLARFERKMTAKGRPVTFAGVGPAAVNTLRAFALDGEVIS